MLYLSTCKWVLPGSQCFVIEIRSGRQFTWALFSHSNLSFFRFRRYKRSYCGQLHKDVKQLHCNFKDVALCNSCWERFVFRFWSFGIFVCFRRAKLSTSMTEPLTESRLTHSRYLATSNDKQLQTKVQPSLFTHIQLKTIYSS